MRIFTSALLLLFVSTSVSAASPKESVYFDHACEPGDQYVISAVGDILLHGPLQREAAKHQDFSVLWRRLIPYFENADIAYANLEGPAAYGLLRSGQEARDPGHQFDNRVYTSYAMFNYHPSLVSDLVRSGFDILSTANNHSLDRHSRGADRTIEALESERHSLAFTGTRKSGESERDRQWYTVVERNGLNVAWLACTFGTNGIPDKRDQVLHCFEPNHRRQIMEIVRSLRDKVDAIIVTPHWGNEYEHRPTKQQIGFAEEVLENGATAVVGAHPHVLQPMTKYKTRDGRETFILYSLGNFVSSQTQLPRRASIVLFLGLTKTSQGVVLNGVKILPTVMTGSGMGSQLLPTSQSSIGRAAFKHISSLFSTEHMIEYRSNPDRVVTNDQCF